MNTSPRIATALAAATDTHVFVVGDGVLNQAPDLFRQFSKLPAMVFADPNTYVAAGAAVQQHLKSAGVESVEPFIFSSPMPHADDKTLAVVREALKAANATAIAVGSGTINDLCKRASFELERPYMSVATAASVDGYASFGAPISERGFKITLPCSAPWAILADVGVLNKAPYEMTAAGYADLVAKITGGSDWIIADFIGADPILPDIWEMTQTPLRDWIANPEKLAAGDAERMGALFEGLTLTGFAMQATHSSRPASGAEHLFSHTWEMAHLAGPDGSEPSHGFKVGIGTIASTVLTELLFAQPFTVDEIEPAVSSYPAWEQREAVIHTLFPAGPLLDRIIEESRKKHLTPEALHERLIHLTQTWSQLGQRVLSQLIPSGQLCAMLSAAGCPVKPEEIGLSRQRVAATSIAAQMIRNRYTALDLAMETGRLENIAQAMQQAWLV